MEIIPAIDLRGGRCVRLYQGDYARETVFSDDPLGVAERWQAEGGQRLHIVDLDGAHSGNPANLAAITAITRRLDIPTQVGGGIRSADTAAALFDAGAARVVVGTAAVSNPALVEELCRRFGSGRVVVALDARDGLVAIRGWTETSAITATELARRMADLGAQRVLYTDIARERHAGGAELRGHGGAGAGQRAGGAVRGRRRGGGAYRQAAAHRGRGGHHRAGALYRRYYGGGGSGGGGRGAGGGRWGYAGGDIALKGDRPGLAGAVI